MAKTWNDVTRSTEEEHQKFRKALSKLFFTEEEFITHGPSIVFKKIDECMKELEKEDMNTLGEAYPKEQARLRQCLINGKEVGLPGVFYCAIIQELLERADRAAIEQDLPEMIKIYGEMKGIKE